jgi:hypothetical protein
MEKVLTIKLDRDEIESVLDDYIDKEYGLQSKSFNFQFKDLFTFTGDAKKISGVEITVEESTTVEKQK